MSDVRIGFGPKVFLIAKTLVLRNEVEESVKADGTDWDGIVGVDTIDGPSDAEILVEVAGRTCYHSFGKGRKTTSEHIQNLVNSAHGSVLEHATWSFRISNISRAVSHELVRHRHHGISQLSQRYVDSSEATFIVPDIVRSNPVANSIFVDACQNMVDAYNQLCSTLLLSAMSEAYPNEGFQNEAEARDAFNLLPFSSKTPITKRVREAARYLLPSACETRLVLTGNGRSWRNFLERRCRRDVMPEMRMLASELLRQLRVDSPTIFGDYSLVTLPDGSVEIDTPNQRI